jgi:hypothetical protein
MDSNYEENEQEGIRLSGRDIFSKIWMSPRMVFKFVTDSNYNRLTTSMLILAGIVNALYSASFRNIGDHLPLPIVLIVCLLGGVIFGWIYFYLYAALLSWTGKWLKGAGNTRSLLRMMSLAFIPSLLLILPFIVRIALYGNEVFQSNIDIFAKGAPTISAYAFFTFVEIAIGVWTLGILIIGISEVQKLSIWKSILNMILPIIIVMVAFLPIAALAFVIRELLN